MLDTADTGWEGKMDRIYHHLRWVSSSQGKVLLTNQIRSENSNQPWWLALSMWSLITMVLMTKSDDLKKLYPSPCLHNFKLVLLIFLQKRTLTFFASQCQVRKVFTSVPKLSQKVIFVSKMLSNSDHVKFKCPKPGNIMEMKTIFFISYNRPGTVISKC